MNYPEWRQHEAKALVELLHRTRRSYRVLGAGPQVILGSAQALTRLAQSRQIKCTRCVKPFGGTSATDVAIQFVAPPS